MEELREDLIRLESKLDSVKEDIQTVELKMVESLSEVNKSIIDNDANLRIHMRRSEMLERQVSLMEDEVKPLLQSLKGAKMIVAVVGGAVAILNFINLFLRFYRF